MDDDGSVADPSRGRVPRGRAREALLEAARDLLAGVTLDDVTEFISVSRLKERTGLSSGAIYSAFSPSQGIGDRPRSAPQNIARSAVLEPFGDVDLLTTAVAELLESLIADAEAGTGLMFDVVADGVAAFVLDAARGEMSIEYTTAWLCAAVSLNDPTVAASLRESYVGYDRAYLRLVQRLLEASNRVPADGLDLERLVTLLVAAIDGAAMRIRYDPALDQRFLSTVIISVWAGATRRADVPDELLGHRVAVPATDPPEDGELRAVMAAVGRVRERAGWAAVTLHKVGQLAGMSDARLAGLFPSRDHLAPLVWDEVVAGLERRADGRAELPVGRQLDELVHDLVEAACGERALVSSVLAVQLGAAAGPGAASRGAPPTDPTGRLAAIVDGLTAQLGWPAGAGVLLTDSVLLRAATTSVRAADLTDLVLSALRGPARS